MFHVWRFDRRRRVLFMVTQKRLSRWDSARVGAVWIDRQSAHAWAREHVGAGKFRVFACEGERCGMAECRELRWRVTRGE